MGKPTSKSKHKIKVGSHLQTNTGKQAIVRRGKNECRILEKHFKLKTSNLKQIYIYIKHYIKTREQKNKTIDTLIKKKKQFKYNTNNRYQMRREGKKKV